MGFEGECQVDSVQAVKRITSWVERRRARWPMPRRDQMNYEAMMSHDNKR
jgi:hypothetical protein